MIEMPEAATLANQMNIALAGKTIQSFGRGELVHKFLWLNRPDEEYATILAEKKVTGASSYGKSIYLYLGADYLLWFSELGGRLLYFLIEQTSPERKLPSKVHLRWDFTDGSALVLILQMWGAVRLLEHADPTQQPEAETGIPPLSPNFTFVRFNDLLESYPEKTRQGIKGFMVTSKYVNGLGNGYLQDILFQAGLHPRRKIPDIKEDERHRLYEAIQETMAHAIQLGGREDERDLFDRPGGYHRLMSNQVVGQSCPVCETPIEKIAYLGGACYVCPQCQT
jgi:formamidopyrimidine-DNA glycosylase